MKRFIKLSLFMVFLLFFQIISSANNDKNKYAALNPQPDESILREIRAYKQWSKLFPVNRVKKLDISSFGD